MKTHKLLLGIIITLLTSPVSAFKPTAEFGHVGIVKDSLKSITRTSSDGSQTFKFSESAILETRDSTAGVDEVTSSRGEIFNPNAHCDDELLPECSRRIIDIKNEVIDVLKTSPPNGEKARQQVGRALHTLQDFYSHSNFIELGRGEAFFSDLGMVTVPRLRASPDDPTCGASFFNLDGTLRDKGLTDLTSGYFRTDPLLFTIFNAPSGKCNHGLAHRQGIHKDAPGRTGHEAARNAAVLGTEDLINQILDAPGINGNDKAIRAFMDVKGSLGFVIDDTGSMGGIISGVKNQVSRIVSLVSDDPKKAPDKYVLVRFGDPDVGSAFITEDAASLKNAVNSLFAHGGGDCPELSMSGMLNAIEASSSGSSLYLFTDATAKDSFLGGNVVAAARAKDITIQAYLFGSCSPIDPAYQAITSETGGQLLFLQRTTSETEKLFNLITPSLTGDLQPILISKSQLNGSKEFFIPVDSSISKAIFSIGMDLKGEIKLFNPSGVEIATGENITEISSGRIFTMNTPEPGLWKLKVTGTGFYTVSVAGNSPIEFKRFNFVELRGRPGHEGFFPIIGEPLANFEHKGLANVFGNINSVTFELRTDAGDLIKVIDLPKGGLEDAAKDDFIGSFTLPSNRFRIYLHGKDEAGKELLRAFPPIFTGQNVKIRSVSDGSTPLFAGIVNKQRFEVTNLGVTDTFSITATDNLGFVSNLVPNTVTLQTNESKIVEVSINVPNDTPDDTAVTLTLVAKGFSTANNIVTSFVVRKKSIKGDLDFDGDVDSDDINILAFARGQLASGSTDVRDIDGDGKITVLDARKATTLCTRLRCARE